MRVKGVCALASCGALSRVQVWVSPCGARGGAGRSRAAVWRFLCVVRQMSEASVCSRKGQLKSGHTGPAPR